MDFALLYDEDPETWSEVQVAILRRLAVTPEPGTNAIDWENVIEEVEDLGRAQRRAIEGLLENAFEHLLKIAADPSSFSAKQWKREVEVSLAQAQAKEARDAAADRPGQDLAAGPPGRIVCPRSVRSQTAGGRDALPLFLR